MSKSAKPSKPLVPTGNDVSHYDLWKAAVQTKAPEAQAPKAQAPKAQAPQAWPDKPATLTALPPAVAIALPLVKEFEGCKLTAYPDPETGAESWTIGWGSTAYADGRLVRRGDRISQVQADSLLAGRLEQDCRLLAQRIPLCCPSPTTAAPTGSAAPGSAPSPRRCRRGRWSRCPRRKAEAALWCASPSQGKAASPDRVTSNPPAGGGVIQHPNPLVGVPRFQQRDTAQLAQRDRTCFSSSCAMLLEAIKPGTLKGANGDDQVLAVVQHLVVVDGKQQTSGDTTDANAQLRALFHYGVTARWSGPPGLDTG